MSKNSEDITYLSDDKSRIFFDLKKLDTNGNIAECDTNCIEFYEKRTEHYKNYDKISEEIVFMKNLDLDLNESEIGLVKKYEENIKSVSDKIKRHLRSMRKLGIEHRNLGYMNDKTADECKKHQDLNDKIYKDEMQVLENYDNNLINTAKLLFNLLLEAKLIKENLEILNKQIFIEKSKAIELLKKHDYDVVKVILDANNVKTNEANTMLNIQLNQYELYSALYDLIKEGKHIKYEKVEDDLDILKHNNLIFFNKYQTYVNVLIENNHILKNKKYTSYTRLLEENFGNMNDINIIKLNYVENYTLIYYKNNITDINNEVPSIYNKKATVLLRLMNIIKENEVYEGLLLLCNNSFFE